MASNEAGEAAELRITAFVVVVVVIGGRET
jgi:hypothetical protein